MFFARSIINDFIDCALICSMIRRDIFPCVSGIFTITKAACIVEAVVSVTIATAPSRLFLKYRGNRRSALGVSLRLD